MVDFQEKFKKPHIKNSYNWMTKINNDPCHRFYMIRRSGKSPSSWNHKKKSIPKINIIKNVFNKIIIILINDQK